MTHFVAFSGGKDSTAVALRLAELGEDFTLLFTATGNELPELRAHIDRVVAMTGCPLVEPPNRSLHEWITEFEALPNWRQRWCTRLIKIVPCIAWLQAHPGSTLSVGLRADEETRVGLYGDYASYRYPLQQWGWKLPDVRHYLTTRGVEVPKRTDCALCYGQRLGEWWALWAEHPEEFARGEAYEEKTGHTFRSRGRDTWPAPLVQLRKRFEAGDKPKGVADSNDACRVCKL